MGSKIVKVINYSRIILGQKKGVKVETRFGFRVGLLLSDWL